MPSLDPQAVDALLARARRDVDDGLLPSCQLALGLEGEILVHEAFGEATTDTRYTIFSATKPVVASVVWQLLADGLLQPTTRVADVIPELSTNGKDAVTLDHVLLHTSGFPRAPLGPREWDTHEGRRAAFARWRLSWEPGSRYEYHPTSAHWVLAELIHAVTGEDHRTAVRERITGPLGLTALALGVPAAEQGDIVDVVLCGTPATPDELEAALGVRAIDTGEVTDEALLSLSRPPAREVGLPGGGGISTAADLAAFYQALLHDPKGLWEPGGPPRRDRRGAQHVPGPPARVPCQPHAGPHRRRRRRTRQPAGHGPDGLPRRVRAQRCRRPGRLGRSRHGSLVRLPHERPGPPPPARAPADHGAVEPGRHLRDRLTAGHPTTTASEAVLAIGGAPRGASTVVDPRRPRTERVVRPPPLELPLMPRRIDIELTSSRDDGTWTWRAAGAKAPKGSVAGTVVPAEAKVGDVLKVDAEFFVDGISITGVVPQKGTRKEPERLELIAPAGKDEPLVTTTLASRSRDERGPRRDGPRRDGPRRDGPRRDGERGGPRREGQGPEGQGRGGRDQPRDGQPREGGHGREAGRPGERGPRKEGASRPPRRTRPEPPPMPVIERPKAKRLRAGKAHRSSLLESLPEEQRPIAEQVVLGGLPAVRQAIEKQNAERTAAGEAAIAPGPLLEIAEKLVPKVRAAEWRDRAEAAQRDLDQLDLRDLRSVVSAAESGPKDEEARALAQALKEGLAARVDAEHATWLAELTATLDVGRIVRALRLSSRPPKAGCPAAPEIAARLTAGAGEALTAEAAPERWVAVLDALAFAPVRDKVIPASLPTELHADVQATIARLATRIPKIAHIFEIKPDRSAPRPKVERRRPPKPKKPQDQPGKGPKPPKDAAPLTERAEETTEASEGASGRGHDAPVPRTSTRGTGRGRCRCRHLCGTRGHRGRRSGRARACHRHRTRARARAGRCRGQPGARAGHRRPAHRRRPRARAGHRRRGH